MADGATVQILYEGRHARTRVKGDSLDALFERYFADKTSMEKEAVKRKYGTEQAVLEAPQRIEQVARDLVDHYRERVLPNGFKAMVVTSSRRAAMAYKTALDAIPDAPESAVVISGGHNDPQDWDQWTDLAGHRRAVEHFKQPMGEHPLSILIVTDMLLTGFDAPVCQVMYLDRKLTDHTLLQAIARVNRTRAQKPCGYVVDYVGLTDHLAEALQVFSSSDVQGALQDLKDEIPKLQAAHTRVKRHLKGVDLRDTEACVTLLADELKRQQFEADFRTFARQMDIVLPDPAANAFLADLKALGKVVVMCRNRYRDQQLTITGCGEKVRALVEEHVRADGVDPRVPTTKLFDVEFEQVLAAHTNDRARASEVEHAIRAHLKVNLDEDPEYYGSLARRLEEIIRNHENRWEELTRQLLLFRDRMEQEQARQNAHLGLSEEEGAFYRVLMAEVSQTSGEGGTTMDERTHQQVLDMIRELVALLREATRIVGFFDKWEEKADIKRQIKRSILAQPFGSKALVDRVTERFMDLAEARWSR